MACVIADVVRNVEDVEDVVDVVDVEDVVDVVDVVGWMAALRTAKILRPETLHPAGCT